MAIRASDSSTAGWNTKTLSVVRSGWFGWTDVSNANINAPFQSMQAFQVSRLSRPGNLGTAYIGVWTGNRSET